MKSREQLHEELCEVLGSEHVYFQPPESVKIVYPCIVYNLDYIYLGNADDRNYQSERRYSITVIHKDPDTDILDQIIDRFKFVRFDRHFTSNNLNHDIFEIYY